MQLKKFDVIIVGGGASGLMCAATAVRRGRSVLVLECSASLGRKILASGGGKANFTNRNVSAVNYVSQNKHFAISSLRRYSSNAFIELMERYKVSYTEKTDGQLFCTKSSKDLLKVLICEVKKSGVTFQTKCIIFSIEKREKFTIKTNYATFYSESLVIATGGISFLTLGGSDYGYKVAHKFKIDVTPLRPGLVPFILKKKDSTNLASLTGISLYASVKCKDVICCGDLLFTHKGFSGPVILKISNYWNVGDELSINFLPRIDLKKEILAWKKTFPDKKIKTLLSGLIARRLVERMAQNIELSIPIKQIKKQQIDDICELFCNYLLTPQNTAGYDKAEVTCGGIDTKEISSKTFETKKVRGLFFIGEILDVTGDLGGYNLQWAWSSGACCGQYV